MKKKEKLAPIHQYYPNAVTTIDCVNRLIDLIEDKFDIDPGKVMLADSICSDDVNSIQYPARTHEFLGPFKMGGLDGYPFTGLTGMGAFAGHVPDDGAVYIFYGPHIGITKDGKIGEINRIGQTKPSGCCGAAKAGLSKLLNDQIIPGNVNDYDYQMNTIEQIFLKEKKRIIGAENQLKEATDVMYEAIEERINYLIDNTNYKCRHVILMGAILINGDQEMGSFCAVRRFDVLDLSTGVNTNLMDDFFA